MNQIYYDSRQRFLAKKRSDFDGNIEINIININIAFTNVYYICSALVFTEQMSNDALVAQFLKLNLRMETQESPSINNAMGLQSLLDEPVRLASEAERLNVELEALVMDNYKVFVENLTCSVHLRLEVSYSVFIFEVIE